MTRLPDGLAVVVKHDCATCVEIVPALRALAGARSLTIISQDDPDFPAGLDVVHDTDLSMSWDLGTEVTPTLYEVEQGTVTATAVGWRRTEWREATGIADLGAELPEHRPGCGSITMEPDVHARLLAAAEGAPDLDIRHVEIGSQEDEHEAMYARGWSDGLPLIPPTPERVAAMLNSTDRSPVEVAAHVPPNYRPATVTKVAVNAVMAGCRPEYFPVVLAALDAVSDEAFNMHGLAATTYFSGPVYIVNGPIADDIGMNDSYNVFGPGNRPNATIGRAVNLVVRNIGGSRPGGIDRSMQGHPAKWGLCFAEREHDSPWSSLAAERGIPDDRSAVTVFAGQGPTPIVDQLAREPDALTRTFAATLLAVAHPKLPQGFDAVLAVSPEHARVFGEAGWTKQQLRERLLEYTTQPFDELVRGAGGMAEGIPPSAGESLTGATDRSSAVAKFPPDGLWFVHAGSGAGLFSGIISGWVRGPKGSQMVTREIPS